VDARFLLAHHRQCGAHLLGATRRVARTGWRELPLGPQRQRASAFAAERSEEAHHVALVDLIVLEAALTGKADFLVTDNRKDFEELAPAPSKSDPLIYRGVRIVTQRECLDAIRAAHQDARRTMDKKRRWP
jgi:hypothetical protein